VVAGIVAALAERSTESFGNTGHPGYGGGLWFAWLDRANTISATYGRSEGRNAFYVRAGFAV